MTSAPTTFPSQSCPASPCTPPRGWAASAELSEPHLHLAPISACLIHPSNLSVGNLSRKPPVPHSPTWGFRSSFHGALHAPYHPLH